MEVEASQIAASITSLAPDVADELKTIKEKLSNIKPILEKIETKVSESPSKKRQIFMAFNDEDEVSKELNAILVFKDYQRGNAN